MRMMKQSNATADDYNVVGTVQRKAIAWVMNKLLSITYNIRSQCVRCVNVERAAHAYFIFPYMRFLNYVYQLLMRRIKGVR